MTADKNNIALGQKHNILLHQLQIYKKSMTTDAQKHSKCLISVELSIVRVLSDQFAAWHKDATTQPGLEFSNNVFIIVNSLLKAPRKSEIFSLNLRKY